MSKFLGSFLTIALSVVITGGALLGIATLNGDPAILAATNVAPVISVILISAWCLCLIVGVAATFKPEWLWSFCQVAVKLKKMQDDYDSLLSRTSAQYASLEDQCNRHKALRLEAEASRNAIEAKLRDAEESLYLLQATKKTFDAPQKAEPVNQHDQVVRGLGYTLESLLWSARGGNENKAPIEIHVICRGAGHSIYLGQPMLSSALQELQDGLVAAQQTFDACNFAQHVTNCVTTAKNAGDLAERIAKATVEE